MPVRVHRRVRRDVRRDGVSGRERVIMPVQVDRTRTVPMDVGMAFRDRVSTERRIKRIARPSLLMGLISSRMLMVRPMMMAVVPVMIVVVVMPGLAHLSPAAIGDP